MKIINSYSVDEELLKRFQTLAKEESLNMSAFIANAIQTWVDKVEADKLTQR